MSCLHSNCYSLSLYLLRVKPSLFQWATGKLNLSQFYDWGLREKLPVAAYICFYLWKAYLQIRNKSKLFQWYVFFLKKFTFVKVNNIEQPIKWINLDHYLWKIDVLFHIMFLCELSPICLSKHMFSLPLFTFNFKGGK